MKTVPTAENAAATADGARLKYKELALHIDVDFWYALEKLKLHTWKLANPVVPLQLLHSQQFASFTPVVAENAAAAAGGGTASEAPVTATSAAVAPQVNLASIRKESLLLGLHGHATGPAGEAHSSMCAASVPLIRGLLQNFNTVDELVALNRKNALITALDTLLLAPLWDGCQTTTVVGEANSAIDASAVGRAWERACFGVAAVFTFADLKSHVFHYSVAFPALDVGSPISITQRIVGGFNAVAREGHCMGSEGVLFPSCGVVEDVHRHLAEQLHRFPERGTNPFIVDVGGSDGVRVLPLHPDHAVSPTAILVIADPSTIEEFPGWPARNMLAALRLARPQQLTSLTLYAVRSEATGGVGKSVLFHCTCDPLSSDVWQQWRSMVDAAKSGTASDVGAAGDSGKGLKVVGWTEKRGGIRSVNLSTMMDPVKLADSSAKLNLSLMKWRMMPDIQLDGLQACKALVLGSGTLGCNVTRGLMMWGVTNITLVDRGNVSYSNPVRQTLFELSDVTNPNEAERCKSVAAANALRRILPSVNAQGVKLAVQMPGHRVDEKFRASAINEIHRLEELILAHDVSFLLMDSRESRWLPTVIAAAHNKPVINVALGFDSYVVMRHGVQTTDSATEAAADTKRLGCYFCNDVVAPQDSMTARTLDQQCTVTRPGVSGIAASTAVELLAQIYNHPLGFQCPHPSGQSEQSGGEDATAMGSSKESVLGVVPHQIRGSVAGHYTYQLHGYQYSKCTACSAPISAAYRKRKEEFVLECLDRPEYIEEICGIQADKAKWEAELQHLDDGENDLFAFDSASSSQSSGGAGDGEENR